MQLLTFFTIDSLDTYIKRLFVHVSRVEPWENSTYSDQDSSWAVRGSNHGRREISLLQNVPIIQWVPEYIPGPKVTGARSWPLASIIPSLITGAVIPLLQGVDEQILFTLNILLGNRVLPYYTYQSVNPLNASQPKLC